MTGRFFDDELGQPVRLSEVPGAVVSLVPSLTESVAATVPGVLVGATDYCVHPAELAVARVGGSKYPDVDRILDLRPELVLANVEENRAEDVDRLRANGIQVYVTRAPASVPAALGSLERLFRQVFEFAPGDPPAWLRAAERAWRAEPSIRARAIVPVWRRPWVVLGPGTFAGDVLRRLGIGNAGDELGPDRYPRPSLGQLRELLAEGGADLVILPDEPYEFTETDGPEAFPGNRCLLVSGRHLTWWGPSLTAARELLSASFGTV